MKEYHFQIQIDDFSMTLVVGGDRSLHQFAEAIIKNVGFDFDHAFQFGDNLRNPYASSECYSLLADMGDRPGPGVRRTYLSQVFTPGKRMLFHFDFGDDWFFLVTCSRIKECGKTVPFCNVQSVKGTPPVQYPNDDDEGAPDEFDPAANIALADLNFHLRNFMEQRNTAPDPEMGGLSPIQVDTLIRTRWDDDAFPLKFNRSLSLEDLKSSKTFHHIRSILFEIHKRDGVKTTAKGNLPRSFVSEIMPIVLTEKGLRFFRECCKVVNEYDVREIHIGRLVSQEAGVIRRYKGKLTITKKYARLIEDENAGELFTLLFLTYFRRFNLGYIDGLPELPRIQQMLGYTFYRLRSLRSQWYPIEKVPTEILLPAVKEEIDETVANRPHSSTHNTLEIRLLQHLEDWGLIESRKLDKEHFDQMEKLRTTPLLRKFINVEGL